MGEQVAPAFFCLLRPGSNVADPRFREGRGKAEEGMTLRIPEVDRELEDRVAGLGLEVVEVEWAGSVRRPVIRVRIDVPGSEAGAGVTVGDCARVSRALEEWLDGDPRLPERYVLEVSSPGVERPLVKRSDFERFAGREAKVKVRGAGTLIGVIGPVEQAGDGWRVALGVAGGGTRWIEGGDVMRATLVFHWQEED